MQTHIYSLNNSIRLATSLSKHSKVPMQNSDEYHKIKYSNVNAIIVGSITNDQDLIDICRIGHHLSPHCCQMVFVIPYLAHSTIDRNTPPDEVTTTKTTISMLDSIPQCQHKNIFIFLDLHCFALTQFFHNSVAIEGCLEDSICRQCPYQHSRYPVNTQEVVGSTNLSMVSYVDSIAKRFYLNSVYVHKEQVLESTTSVKDKVVFIYDDMIRTGLTLSRAIDCYMEKGAKAIVVIITHFAVTDEMVVRKLIKNKNVIRIFTTNTHPNCYLVEDPKLMVFDITYDIASLVHSAIQYK